MLPFAACLCSDAGAKQEGDVEAFDEFLDRELSALRDRLLHQHLALAHPGSPKLAPSPPNLSRDPARLPGDAYVNPFVEEAAELAEIVPNVPGGLHTGHDTNAEVEKVAHRWATLAVALCEREKELEQDEEVVLPTFAYNLSLELRDAWKLSYQAARLSRRRRTESTMDTRRFNEVHFDSMNECCLQRFVLGPDSRVQFAWALIATLLIVWDMITVPLEFFPMDAFTQQVDNVAVASLAFWMLDVPLHLVFGVQVSGVVEMRPMKLARMYLKSWLAVDLMVIAVDTVVLSLKFIYFAEANPVLRSGRFLRALRIVRLVRLIRVAKLEREVTFIANRLLSTYSLMALKVIGYLALMLAINHLIACCWYGVGNWTSYQENWLAGADIDPESVGESYVAALHWSLTQFTPATNPIAPQNGWERFYAIWVILLAMASFSSFIGSIGTTVSSMRAARRGQIIEQGKLELFFTERQLSLALFSKVKATLREDKREQLRIPEEEVSLIQGIPERYKVELHKEIFMHSLVQVGIWPRWTNREEPHFFSCVCHQAMKELASKAGQDVFLPRAKCSMVYTLQKGSMEYLEDEVRKDPVDCEPGTDTAIICLPSLWAQWEHTGRLTAKSGVCHYAGIDCERFCGLVVNFGGRLCEYLKVLGILIVGEIEGKAALNIRVSDISVPSEIPLDDLAPRAEQFSAMKSLSAQESTVVASVRLASAIK